MRNKLGLLAFVLAAATAFQTAAFSLDDIQFWTGSGTNRAAMVIQWTSPEVANNSSVPDPVTKKTLVWGFRWNGAATAEDMFNAILASDKQLFAGVSDNTAYGKAVLSLGYDLDNNRLIGVRDGTNILAASSLTNAPSDFTNGLVVLDYAGADVFQSLDIADVYWGGWFGPNWELWQESGGNGGFTNAPLRGSSAYWTPDDTNAPFSGSDGQWHYADLGMSDLQLKNGSWIGWTVAAGGLDLGNPDDRGTVAWGLHKRAPSSLEAASTNLSPYAVELTTSQGPFGPSPYNDPTCILGEPTSLAVNFDPVVGNSPFHIKLVEAAYNRDLDGKKVIVTLNRASTNGSYNYASVTVKFDHVIYDDPANPYGIDFEVFGNTFYVGSGFVGDTADMRTYNLVGGAFAEPMLVSVSPDGTNWYHTNGPYCDSTFPTHGFQWDADQYDATGNGWTKQRMDFTKPVNPALDGILGAQGATLSAFNALKFYNGSGGGTGFDLAPSGFSGIQYIRVNAAPGFYAGEVDAFSAVRPAVLGESLTIAPANLANGTSALFFQDPGNIRSNAVIANFYSLDGVALVTPKILSDTNAIAAIPNRALESIVTTVQPLLSNDIVQATFDISLNLGTHYKGSGNDLDIVSWNGTNWLRQAFTFNSNSNVVTVSGLTNSIILAAVQIVAPALTIRTNGNGIECHFVPVVGWSNVLERTINFSAWTFIDQVTPTNAQPTMLIDHAPPFDKAFYRLRIVKP